MDAPNTTTPQGHPEVDELYIQENVLTAEQLKSVMEWLSTTNDWQPVTQCANSRKVIHYGYRYNYNGGKVSEGAAPMHPVCEMLRDILARMAIEGVEHAEYVQCIVNKYEPGQGIGAHIDAFDFGPVIGCFVFNIGPGETSKMTFTLNHQDTEVATPHNSLYIMTGLSRYNYRHALVGKRAYAPRVSVTFRSMAPKTRDTTTHKIIGWRDAYTQLKATPDAQP